MPAAKKYFTEEERKAAHMAAVERYQARNREKIKAVQAAYREENRNKVNAYAREYYEKNLERLRALKRAYYERNKEKINAKAREKKAAEKAAGKAPKKRVYNKYLEFTKEAQARPVFVNYGERLTDKQKAILNRIATAITAEDIE